MSFAESKSEESLVQPPPKKKMKTKEDIKRLMDSIFQDLQKTREAGQKEYAHDSENAFGNFERLSKQLNLEREKVLWVYVQKHIDGVVSYLNGHKSQREDVRGRIKDIIVYLILLWGMIDDNENPIMTASEVIERFGGVSQFAAGVDENEHVESKKKHKFFEPSDSNDLTSSAFCKHCTQRWSVHRIVDNNNPSLRECPI